MNKQNVSGFDPNKLSMTSSARAHVLAQQRSVDGYAIHLAIKESGCNGYMYELEAGPPANTELVEFAVGDNITLSVEKNCLPLIKGTEIDCVTEGLNKTLKFNNPNADSQCGCGESFSIVSNSGS